MHKLVGLVMIVGIGFVPLNPSPTNPLCYNSPAYRNTHEQECVINNDASGTPHPPGSGGAGNPGLLGTVGRVLHGLTGGLL